MNRKTLLGPSKGSEAKQGASSKGFFNQRVGTKGGEQVLKASNARRQREEGRFTTPGGGRLEEGLKKANCFNIP